MSFAQIVPDPALDRRLRILAAAEQAFVRHGFHAATMQHVAEAAGMSAGNLYRYFPSKEALVEGLCANDRSERAKVFMRMNTGRLLIDEIGETLRDHLLTRPPEKARLIVEIWAEAGRNPRVAEITRALDAEVLSELARLVEDAKSRGAAPASLDGEFVARTIFTLVAGLFKRMALEPGFDVENEAAMTIAVLRALFAGAIAPARGN